MTYDAVLAESARRIRENRRLDGCSYLRLNQEQCGHRVTVVYQDHGLWVASLCRAHDSAAARAFGEEKNYTRIEVTATEAGSVGLAVSSDRQPGLASASEVTVLPHS